MKTISTGLLMTIFMAIAVAALIYFFMKAPKKNVNDQYNSLGNHGISQRMTGKNWSYNDMVDRDMGDTEMIPNSINQKKSDVVQMPNLLARRRVMMANGFL